MAQAEGQLTQYFATPTYYNPGAIGNTDFVRIRAGSRMQWIGIDNAPRDFILTADSPLKLFGKRIGLGIVASSESAGLFRNLSIGLQAGYKIKLFKGELTGAVQIGFANEVFKGSEVFIPDDNDYHQPTDDAIPDTDMSGNALDVGVGVFYNKPKWWVGVSCLHVNSPSVSFSSDNGGEGSASSGGVSGDGEGVKKYQFTFDRTLYFMAGGNIPIKNTLFEVMPSMMFKTDFNFWRAEVTGRVRWKKFITAGIGYRYDDAVSAILAAEYKGFYVGYSYDYPLSAISKASSGSHEIIAGYSLKLDFSDKNKNKHKSIRIM
jgi:bacteroidetes-specific putative membrane protein